MRPVLGLLLGLLACGGTEPDYPPFDGPSPTVSGFTVSGGTGDGDAPRPTRGDHDRSNGLHLRLLL